MLGALLVPAAVVAVVLFGGGVGEEAASPAATVTTSTSPAPATTSATTSVAPLAGSTTTTSAEPPGPTVLLEETFDVGTAAAPVYGADVMGTLVTGRGRFEIRAGSPGVLPVVYPDPFPDMDVTMRLRVYPAHPGALFGAVVLADDPSDGVLDHYVLVYLNPEVRTVGIVHYEASAARPFSEEMIVGIPDEVGFRPRRWVDMRLVVRGSRVAVFLGGIRVIEWTSDAEPSPGFWGPMVVGGTGATPAAPDVLRIDDVRVVAVG